MDTIKINKKNVLMIAHRGVSGLETENTKEAFIIAGNKSYYGIETDVHVTLDGKFSKLKFSPLTAFKISVSRTKSKISIIVFKS